MNNLRTTLTLLRLAIALGAGGLAVGTAIPTHGQIAQFPSEPATGSRVATLEQQLTNQLRATTAERQAYIRIVVQLTENGQLEERLVQAIQRYATRKNSTFPFPYFERAMRFEAAKRGIELPPVQLLAGTASTYR